MSRDLRLCNYRRPMGHLEFADLGVRGDPGPAFRAVWHGWVLGGAVEVSTIVVTSSPTISNGC